MSYQFHIPPINQLSFNQQHAYGFPLDERECLLITGCPGSGKTTVANFRASALQQEQRTFQYIIYARVLHAYVRQSFSDPALDIAPEKVATFGSWFYGEYKENVMAGPRKIIPEVLARHFARSTVRYNEMILDEGQDLDPRVIQGLPQVCTSLTICADDAQNVFDGDENEPNSCEGMRTALEAQGLTVHPIHLGVNYRNTPEIYAFAKAFVPHNPAATVTQFIKAPGQRPALLKCSNTASMLQKIENIITNRGSENIGILCDYQSQITAISRHLEQKGIAHTAFHAGMHWSQIKEQLRELKNIVVCTNRSAKGLEFQTVVIPYAESLRVDEDHKKCYYVACTRAERNLFLLTSTMESNMPMLSQINADLYETI